MSSIEVRCGHGLTSHVEYNDFKEIKAQTTRGNVTSGDIIASPQAPPDVLPYGYASARITAEQLVKTQNGVYVYTTDSAGDIELSNTPVRKFTVRVYVTIGANTYEATDSEGDGILRGYGIQGATIDYETGVIDTITLTPDPGAGEPWVYADYSQDMEGADDLPKVITALSTKAVNARVYALKDTIGLEQSYALRRRFGMIAEDEIATDLIAAINSELMTTLIRIAVANLPAGSTTDWDRTPPDGVSLFEHKMSFLDSVASAEANLLAYAGRGTVNTMIAGRNVAAIIGTLPGFEKISDSTTIGPHIYGTLNGMTVVRVPSAIGTFTVNHVLCLYKGISPFEAAMVYAPYMPLTSLN